MKNNEIINEIIKEYKIIQRKYKFKFLLLDVHYPFLIGSVYLIPIIKCLKRLNFSEKVIAEVLENITDSFVENISDRFISLLSKCMLSYLGNICIIIFQYNPLTYFNKYRFKYIYREDREYDLGFDYLKCGICTLYKEEMIYDYVKHLCSLDYNMFEKIGFILIKNRLLSKNDCVCSFRLRINK